MNWKGVIKYVIIGAAFSFIFVNTAINYQQTKALQVYAQIEQLSVEQDVDVQRKLWDLHYRVTALEQEDERLAAHIKWFVMRRSGTDELRKMEAAVAKLEARGD